MCLWFVVRVRVRAEWLVFRVGARFRWGCDKFQRCGSCGSMGECGGVREAERSKESVALEDVCTCAAPLRVIQL